MNLKNPVSTIMSRDLVTIGPEDNLLTVKKLFDMHSIHHLPVVDYKKLVGLVSKSDYQLYANSDMDPISINAKEDQKLRFTKVKQIMVVRLGKLEPDDKIELAIDVFLTNCFHCLPVVKGDELVGLLTPFDILQSISTEYQLSLLSQSNAK